MFGVLITVPEWRRTWCRFA